MKKYLLLSLLVFCFSNFGISILAQTPPVTPDTLKRSVDSLTRLTTGYLELEKIQKQQTELSRQLEATEGSLQAIAQSMRTETAAKYDKRVRKISLAPDFIRSANVSISALTLSNTLTDYLSDLGRLNNPENEELGVSLSTSVTKIIDENLFHGKAKVGKQNKGRFMSIVTSIVKSPLVSTLTAAIPVVSSLGAVTDLVNSLAVNNDDVEMADLEAYKTQIAGYVAFYEALGHAGNQFNLKINNLVLRTKVLENLLRNYAFERTEAVFPEFAAQNTLSMPLNELLRQHYDRDLVFKALKKMEQESTTADTKATDFDALLRDSRLAFPDFAVNQARYIVDELNAVSNEYIVALNDYQTAIETVLTASTTIVTAEKSSKKIETLRAKLVQLEKAFRTAVNVEDVQERFQKLTGV